MFKQNTPNVLYTHISLFRSNNCKNSFSYSLNSHVFVSICPRIIWFTPRWPWRDVSVTKIFSFHNSTRYYSRERQPNFEFLRPITSECQQGLTFYGNSVDPPSWDKSSATVKVIITLRQSCVGLATETNNHDRANSHVILGSYSCLLQMKFALN